MNGNDSKNFDKLDALIMLAGDVLIKEDVDYVNSLDLSESNVSKNTDKKVYKLIKQADKQKTYRPWQISLKRVAVAALIICTLLFACAMNIGAIREYFQNAIIEWFDEYVSVRFDTSQTSTVKMLDKAIDPTYVPEGLELYDRVITDYDCSITYNFNGVKAVMFIQELRTSDNVLIDDECIIEKIEINRYTGVLATYNKDTVYYTLIWEDDNYSYNILTFEHYEISKNDLIKIAESIY